MRGLLAGAGARELLERGGTGSVVASFSEACYVEVGQLRIALVAPGIHPGPVHLVLDASPPRSERGRSVRVEEGALVVEGTRIDVASVTDWRGSLPPPSAVREHASAMAEVAQGAGRGSPLLAEPFAGRASRARGLLKEGRLEEAAGLLGGLGPGLTPSGDDALAGIVFGLRAALGPGIEAVAVRAAARAPVGVFGRSALACAARGQALAPVHDLVSWVVREDRARGETAARAVAAVGETSGADLLVGLGWAVSAGGAYALAASEPAGAQSSASRR